MSRAGKSLLAVVAVAVAAVVVLASARASAADDEFQRTITAELAARDAEAAEIFSRANAARDSGDFEAAAGLYEQVRARAPWFSHATRRLCAVEASRGNQDRALALCREAFAADPSAFNESALAQVLLQGSDRQSQSAEALRLAREAAGKAPHEATVLGVLCEAALTANDVDTLSSCAQAMRRDAPNELSTHLFSALDHGIHGRLDEAEVELEDAHRRGLPDKQYRAIQKSIDESRSPLDRYGRIAWRGLLAWLVGFALLLGAGALLSHATLRTTSRVSEAADGHARGFESALRRMYRVVLLATCAYYYASLPIVALVVLGCAGGLVYACLVIGTIPIKLVLIALLIVVWSLWAIAKSLLARGRDEDPGERLALEGEPRLRALLDEVAARIGTRPVDSVYVTPGTDVAVFERGGLIKQLRGKSERCLVLGAGVLDGLQVRELKAILAHEYGHFRNEDTAGGGFALAVRRSLVTMAMHLIRGRVASPLNPAWWFVRGFHALFLRVSHGASRLQEVLADRWAASAYGTEAFTSGLEHVVQQTIRFDAHLTATLDEVVAAKQPVANVYTYEPKKGLDAQEVTKAVEKEMSRPGSPYDSHPRPADRIAWVSKLAVAAPTPSADDASSAWTLLASRQAVETRMTEHMRSRLAAQGIHLTPAG
jgi:Zn-dependent protease with chaperone function